MFLTVPMPETEAEHAAESTRCCLKRLRKATSCSAKKTGHGHGHEQTAEWQSLCGVHVHHISVRSLFTDRSIHGIRRKPTTSWHS